MAEFNTTKGYGNWVNNDGKDVNPTHMLPSNSMSNSTLDGTNLQKAGFWTLKDIIIVSCITIIMFILSVLFYAFRYVFRKRWPISTQHKADKVEEFEHLDEQYPKQNWFEEDRGTNINR